MSSERDAQLEKGGERRGDLLRLSGVGQKPCGGVPHMLPTGEGGLTAENGELITQLHMRGNCEPSSCGDIGRAEKWEAEVGRTNKN